MVDAISLIRAIKSGMVDAISLIRASKRPHDPPLTRVRLRDKSPAFSPPTHGQRQFLNFPLPLSSTKGNMLVHFAGVIAGSRPF